MSTGATQRAASSHHYQEDHQVSWSHASQVWKIWGRARWRREGGRRRWREGVPIGRERGRAGILQLCLIQFPSPPTIQDAVGSSDSCLLNSSADPRATSIQLRLPLGNISPSPIVSLSAILTGVLGCSTGLPAPMQVRSMPSVIHRR